MAFVNDGNLLQHFIEAEVAECVAAGERGIRLTCTHSMRPVEATPRAHLGVKASNRRMRRFLERLSTMPDPPTVGRAYLSTDTTAASYPNTARLLEALLGTQRIVGVLCEKVRSKAEALQSRYADRDGIVVVGGSWRDARQEGLLNATEVDRPWLFSMDPFSFYLGDPDNNADASLYPGDLGVLEDPWRSWLDTDQPGAITLFVYKVEGERRPAFRTAIKALAERLEAEHAVIEQKMPSMAPNVAAIISRVGGLPSRVKDAWAALWAAVKESE